VPQPDTALLKTIRDLSQQAGLLGPAVARATAPSGAAEHLKSWLAAGHHGEMAYMARLGPARADPRTWAPWAKSVALFAEPYDGGRPAAADPARAAISRYARGEDYHRVLRRKLEALSAVLRRNERRALPFVDSSPLMEKALAAAGGLGWLGKNGNLLREGAGSFFFLGGLATDALWTASPPVEEQCGTCDLCITACPTSAIAAPGVVDARRCISYLTIELKGPIPLSLRPGLGNRVFGCDDCQDACPFNADGLRATEPAYGAGPGLDGPPLLELAEISETEFLDRFRGSPVRRARWPGFMRNVLVALGNWGRPEALEVLRRRLSHREGQVRSSAAWALGRIGGATARQALLARQTVETEASVAEEIEWALGQAHPSAGDDPPSDGDGLHRER
jgi:epoxyqueuosine reductase